MTNFIKICGVTSEAAIAAACAAGATHLGFMFNAASRRNLDLPRAVALSKLAPAGVARVAVTVDADDATLRSIHEAVRPDVWQLHGSESPARVASVAASFGAPVIKALGVATADDVARAAPYQSVADFLLFDAKPPTHGAAQGGHGRAFDWSLLRTFRAPKPWFLAGGLTPDTVGDAIVATGAPGVDVSSGVEDASGCKDPHLIARFCAAAHLAFRQRVPA